MAVLFEASGGVASVTGSSVSPATPASTAVGDLLVAIAGVSQDYVLSGSAGWTLIGFHRASFGHSRNYMWYRVADGGASDGIEITTTASRNMNAAVFRLSGADAASPLDVFTSSGANAPVVVPAQTISANGSLAVISIVSDINASTVASVTSGTYVIRENASNSPVFTGLTDAVDMGSDGGGTVSFSPATIRYTYVSAIFKPAVAASPTLTLPAITGITATSVTPNVTVTF